MERAVLDMAPPDRGRGPRSVRWLSSADIARRLYGREPTEAQLRGLRRAIRSLADKRLIVTEKINGPVNCSYVTMHYVARSDRRRAAEQAAEPHDTGPARIEPVR